MHVSRDSNGGDMTFGFSIYDSHVGGYMLSYQLNMVAQGMGIPKRVATTTGCDLNGDDLINFLTLITLVTDKNVVEELNLRSSRSSRSSDVPAVETSKVLHTLVKSTFMHKIQKASVGNSSSSGESFYGYLVIFTPSVGAKEVLHGYVGKDVMEKTGSIEQAFLKHLPMSLWKSFAMHNLSCAWISGNSVDERDGILDVIQESIKQAFPSFCMNSLDVLAAPGMSRKEFGNAIGFKCDEVTSSDPLNEGKPTVDAFWSHGDSHASIEFLQTSMAGMRPLQSCITPLKSRSLKLKHSSQIQHKKRKSSKKDVQKAMVGRGKRAMKNAHHVHKSSDKPDSKGACQHTNSTVNQHQVVHQAEYKMDDISSMSVSDAIAFAREKVADLKTQVLGLVERAAQNDVSIADKALKGLQSIIGRSFKSVEKLHCSSSDSSTFSMREVKASFVKGIPVAVPDLQKMHRETTFEKNYTVSWTATIEILLRLLIASYSMTKDDDLSEGMHKAEYAATEDIMHIIVATMSPIPSQGHNLFLRVIKPVFSSALECDIKELEKAIWDEEEMAVDEDGALADFRLAAASMEESGETPGVSPGNAPDCEKQIIIDGMQQKQVPVHSKVAACKEASLSNSHGAACSGEGSGIQGSTIGTTTLSGARSKLSQSNLVSRRFNNSKQYGMQVRANRLKPKTGAAGTKKHPVQNAQYVQTKEQVPDTPQVEKSGLDKKPPICSTPDTGMAKQTCDVIPNTSPREDSCRPKHISRIGSIRQPLFEDDKNAFEDCQNVNDKNTKTEALNNRNTWLSGALVRRKKGATSIATRMGEMNGMNSSELPTTMLDTKDSDANKEIMSPLKPKKPNSDHDRVHSHANGGEYFDQDQDTDMDLARPGHEGDQEHCMHIDEMITCRNDVEGGRDAQAHPEDEKKQSADTTQHTCDIKVVLPACTSSDHQEALQQKVDQLSHGSGSLFNANRSDDEDSMAARNECSNSEESSAQLCEDEGITSPSRGNNKENHHEDTMTPRKLPMSMFDVDATPLVKSDVDNKKPSGKRNPKAGRLGKMLAGPSSRQIQTTPPCTQGNKGNGSPGSRSITVEDRGSPCKPSPGSRSFGSLPKQSETPDYSSDTDSCVGDSPDMVIAMKPLMHDSPENDSDEEDAAILNAAANGGLSPAIEEIKPTSIVRKKRRRSLLAATKGLLDTDGRKKAKQAPKQAFKTPKQQAAKDEKPPKIRQVHLTNPLVRKKKSVVEGTKKKKMCKMPLEGDEVICLLPITGEGQRSHCVIRKICEAQLRGTKGWICHVEVVPVQSNTEESLKIKLDSSKEVGVESPLDGPGSWCRVDPSSPKNPKIVADLPNETAAHNTAVRVSGDIYRQESVTILKASEMHGAVVLSSPRRRLQPCTLTYDGEALASAEKIQTTPQGNLIESRCKNVSGVELFPETVLPCSKVSPEARAAAGNMLGSLYPHLQPMVSSKVVKILSSPLGTR